MPDGETHAAATARKKRSAAGALTVLVLAVLVLAVLVLTYAFGRYAGGGVTAVDEPLTTGYGSGLMNAPSGAAGPRR